MASEYLKIKFNREAIPGEEIYVSCNPSYPSSGVTTNGVSFGGSGAPINLFWSAVEQASSFYTYILTQTFFTSNFTIELHGDTVTLTTLNGFPFTGSPYGVSNLTTPELVDFTIVPTFILDPLVYHDISIEIIDTQTNSLPLVVEYTLTPGPVLKFDGGDDFFAQLMKSSLVFDMIDRTYADAHFYHLFTGDENQFRVEVYGIDIAGTKMLMWQGFLLPDLYKEPYRNGLVPVEFTATDMLESLKGMFLDPWYFNSIFPITKLLTYLLAKTGLQQKMIINPSIIPNLVDWTEITVNTANYFDGTKYTDCNTILTGILEAQGLRIYSFRGYWFIDGITTFHEQDVLAMEFDLNGDFEGYFNYTRNIQTPLLATIPLLTTISPFKIVEVDFDYKTQSNLFPDDIVSGQLMTYLPSRSHDNEVHQTMLFKYWQQNYGTTDFELQENVNSFILEQISNVYDNDTENISNYIACTIKPFVEALRVYELEISATLEFKQFTGDEGSFRAGFAAGNLDHMFRYQVMVNNSEVYTNRPSVDTSHLNNFDFNLQYAQSGVTNYRFGSGNNKLVYTLKKEITMPISGKLEFRWLQTCVNQDAAQINRFVFTIDKFSLKPIASQDLVQKTTATRPINYTINKTYNLKIAATTDESILNVFGLNIPVSNIYEIEVAGPDSNDTYSDITTGRRVISDGEKIILFKELHIKDNLFNTSASGVKTWYNKVFYQDYLGVKYITYIVSGTEVLVPENGYSTLVLDGYILPQLTSSDTLKYIYVSYNEEDISKRAQWKIKNGTVVNNYIKTFAATILNMQNIPVFRLEAEAKQLIFPHDIIGFGFNDDSKNMLPSTLTINLFQGTTNLVATEDKYATVVDQTYLP